MSRVKLIEGNKGEDLAVEFLRKQGFKIIERNFRMKGGEIDIVAIDPSTDSAGSPQAGSGPDGTLVFVEVKTRTSNQFGTPLEAITYWKLKALIKSAEFYKITHKNLPEAMRIDAVTVMFDDFGEPQLELVKNIS